MIIREIHIDGFGIFNGFSVKNLRKGINILLGDNEAGKSTLLKFLRYTLFGYPRLKEQRMPPLQGGDHGGRITGILSGNKEVVFGRKGDNQLNLVYEGNTSQNEALWYQLLGNATQLIYENVYAFSLDELLNIDSLSVSGVEDKIFSIGAGMGNISIGEVLNDIQKSVDEIYSQRGIRQTIPAVLRIIQEKKAGIKAIQENLPRYQKLTAEIQDLTDQVSEIEENISRDRVEKEKLENYLKCYESFIRVARIDEEMSQLQEPKDYPKDGPERLNELEKEEKDLNNRIDELQKGRAGDKGIEEIEEELKSISFNDDILKEKAKVNFLKANIEKYKQTITDRSEDSQKIIDLNRAVHEQLKAINSDWTEQNIVDFANILVHQDRIKDFREKLESIKNKKIELEGQRNILLASQSRINPNTRFILISLILLLISIPLFYNFLHVDEIIYLVSGTICVVAAFLIFFGRKYLIKESPDEKIGEQLLETDTKEKGLRNDYGNYLEKELNLRGTLSVESASDILNRVVRLKKEISERDDLDRKQKTTKDPYIEGFDNEVRSVSGLLKNNEPENDIETLVNQITEEFDSAEEQSGRKEKLEESLLHKKKELVKNRKNLIRNNQAITELLKSLQAADRNDFRTKYEVNDKARELIERRRNSINTIETIVGLNKAGDVIGFLKTHEQAGLREEVTRLEVKLTSMAGELKSRNNELGEKKSDIKKIEGESELAEEMTRLEIERQKLTDAYKEWITGKIALRMLMEVREKYEKEKQPVIIQNSIRHFDGITGGRYKRIHVALEKRDITVFDSREASKTIGQLSRGTREQLLISLRLGFIEEYELRAEPLPVVADEILVNFDLHRAKKTAEIFQEFSENRQFLLFTCHPMTVDYFDRSGINLINL